MNIRKEPDHSIIFIIIVMLQLELARYDKAAVNHKWIAAMKEELKIFEKNQMQKLMDRTKHKKVIEVKWVYKTKLNSDGFVNMYKARLVVK